MAVGIARVGGTSVTTNIFTTDPAERSDVARPLDLLELLPHSREDASRVLDEDFTRELHRVLGGELVVVWNNISQTWPEDIRTPPQLEPRAAAGGPTSLRSWPTPIRSCARYSTACDRSLPTMGGPLRG